MKTWYTLSNKANAAAVSIYDEIGHFGVTAKSFIEDFNKASAAADSVEVSINSPGGDMFAGLAIYNALRASGKKVTVKVAGVAASAASLIAMAGDEIEMPENTFMMVHNPYSLVMGDHKRVQATADMLVKAREVLVNTYAKRTGRDEAEISDMLDAETWLTAKEAVDAGFATRVVDNAVVHASFDLDRLPENVRAVYNAASAKGEVPEVPEVPAAQDAEAPVADEKPDAIETEAAGAEDTKADEPKAEEIAFADQVKEVANAAGFELYAAQWATEPSTKDIKDVLTKVENAKQVKALCALAKKDDMADGLIRKGATLADARIAVFDALADTEEISTSRKKENDPQNKGAQPTAVGTKAIWAARQANQGGRK